MLFQHEHNSGLGALLFEDAAGNGRRIRKIIAVGCCVNALLMILKLTVGYYGHSDALMADGYHSINDFAADLIMLLFIGISFRQADKRYSFGYGKFETFSTFIISLFLLFVAFHITYEAIESIQEYASGTILPQPDVWTVIVVIISMCAKEGLFRYYRWGSHKTGTTALLTNAWHHRSDAMASIATLIGVSFSHFLGESWRILDPVASLILVIFIVVAAIRMLWPAFTELMDHSCNATITEKAESVVTGIKGVKKIVSFKSRKNGHYFIFHFTIAVNPSLTVEEAGKIAGEIENNLQKALGQNIMISVSTIPFYG